MVTKIAIISGSYPNMKCGVGDYTDVLVSYLSDIGIDVDVLTSANREVVRNDQIKPIITNWGLSCIKEIFKYCKSNNINIVHIQYPTKGYGYKIGTNLLPLFNKIIKIFSSNKLRIVTTIHEFSQSHILRKISIVPLILFSDDIILTDQSEENKINRLMPFFIDKSKYKIIHIGSNILPNKAANCTCHDDSKLITYFGFIRPDKGIDTLLKAIPLTKVYSEDDFKLAILAELNDDDEYHMKIKNLIKKLNIDREKIDITGYLPSGKISEYLMRSKLSVLPFRDGITCRRSTFIASVIHDTPVLSTYTKLTSVDLYDTFRNYLVEPNNVSGLAENIDKFFYDKGYKDDLISKTRDIKKLFDWENIAYEHKLLHERRDTQSA
ncbi:MAG: glycosyltransferase [Acetomicrobium sp.]|nr:glycosyltransferase [Acetomicrobium sp.]